MHMPRPGIAHRVFLALLAGEVNKAVGPPEPKAAPPIASMSGSHHCVKFPGQNNQRYLWQCLQIIC